MRYNPPLEFQERVKSGFLFMPRFIKNEWRWLEFAEWRQIYKYKILSGLEWHDIEWID